MLKATIQESRPHTEAIRLLKARSSAFVSERKVAESFVELNHWRKTGNAEGWTRNIRSTDHTETTTSMPRMAR